MATAQPTLRVEKRLLRDGRSVVFCLDEVGRGSLAGPVSAGVVAIDASVRRPLAGVRDSKLLTPEAREALVPRIHRWVVAGAVGHASAAEIDAVGLTAALRLAGQRALAQMPLRPDVVLLDGNFDWLTPPAQAELFTDPDAPASGLPASGLPESAPASVAPEVITLIKADMKCAAVAAASVLAKVERDRLMAEMASRYPGYDWETNKGYATPAHLDALRRLGPCDEHRRSWRLPTAP